MSLDEDIQHLLQLKIQHERNIRSLEEILANYGLDRPIHLLNSLTFEQEALQVITARLDALEGRTAETGPSPTPRPNNLPRRAYFVGREREIEMIIGSLRPSSRTFIVAIEGLGGVGKSALAIEIGYRSMELGEVSTVIWTSAKESILTAHGVEEQDPEFRVLHDIFVIIGSVLNYPAIGTAPFVEQPKIAIDLLSKQTTLLIIDNLETLLSAEREQIVAFIRKTPVTVKAIVTSRERIIEGHTVRLQGLPPDESIRLIEWTSQQRDLRLTHHQIQQIIEVTGGLPLAMIWIQSQMAMLGRSASQILEQLMRDPNLPLLRFCFNRSWHMLSQIQAQHLLIALGLHIDSAGRAALYMIGDVGDTNRADAAVAELVQLSLIQHDQSEDRFEMLQLTRTFVRNHMKEFKSFVAKAELHMAQYYLLLASQHSGYEQWREFDRLLLDRNNILRVAQWLYKEMQRSLGQRSARPSRKTIKFAEMLASLVRAFGSVLWQRAYWYERLTLTHAALEAAEILEEWSTVGTFRRNIAWIYFYQGDNVRAKQWAMSSLEAVVQTNDRPLIAAAKRALGTIEIRLQNFEVAEQLLMEALSIYQAENMDDYELYNRGFSQQGLADLAYEQRNFLTARRWYQSALDTWHTPGRKDPVRHISYSLNGLGFVAIEEAQLDIAIELFERSMGAAEEFGRIEELARAKLGLARVAALQARVAEALTYAAAALDIFRSMGMQYEIQLTQHLIDSVSSHLTAT